MSTMPAQKPHRSVQEVETPTELIRAVERRFGLIGFDLAASAQNAKARQFFTRADDALTQNWALGPSVRVAWLNPEFGDVEPWAEKCRAVRRLSRWTLMLVPMGTQDWATEHMWGQAYVLKLKGRVQFVGHSQGFPKDLVLAAYGFSMVGEEVWDWRNEMAEAHP
jgi:phage N-6-adenine-methyltransferase